MENKTIWYCHHYAGSPSLGMSYRPYYFTREFVHLGYNAYIIGANEHHLLQKKCSQKEPVLCKDIDGVRFVHLKTMPYQGNGLGRIMNMLSYVWRLRFNLRDILAITGPPDIIIVSSSHLFHYPILEKIARKYGAKLIFEVRDLWPLSLVELLRLSRFNPLILWLSSIEKRAYQQADAVVSVLDKVFPYMNQKGLDASRFHVIPNGVSTALFRNYDELSEDTLRFLMALKTKGQFLLGYAGALGEPNAMSYLVSAMALLKHKKYAIQCVIVGEGSLKKKLTEDAYHLGLDNIHFLGAIPKYQIPAFLKRMDALYLGWNALDIYKYGVSPNKIFDYMMSERPIIESGGATKSMVDEFQCGIQCEPTQIEAIAEAIATLSALSVDERQSMGARGKKTVENFYDYRILAQKYAELF